MSGTSTADTNSSDSSQRWDALDNRNERLVEASHPLLREPDRDRPEAERAAAAAR